MKKYLIMCLMAIAMCSMVVSCSDDDDEPIASSETVDVSGIAGEWLCTNARVTNFSQPLDDFVKTILSSAIEATVGETITILSDEVKTEGNVVIVINQGIKWHILECDGNTMRVRYEMNNYYGFKDLVITVDAEFRKVL